MDRMSSASPELITTPDLLTNSPPLFSVCSICSSPAASHLHYGAVCCYSCRAFFRRGISPKKKCIYITNKCHINQFNRTNCKKCRYERCLEFGMKPHLVGAVLKRKQNNKNILENKEDTTKVTENDSEDTSKPINLSKSEEVVSKSTKNKYFDMEGFPDNFQFTQTIVPMHDGGLETVLTEKKDFMKKVCQRSNHEFQNIQSMYHITSKSPELPYNQQGSHHYSSQSLQTTEQEQCIKVIEVENEQEDNKQFIKTNPEMSHRLQSIYQSIERKSPELENVSLASKLFGGMQTPIYNKFLANSNLKRPWAETINGQKSESQEIFRHRIPIITAYDRLKQNAFFDNRKHETVTSLNEEIDNPEQFPTFASPKRPCFMNEYFEKTMSNQNYDVETVDIDTQNDNTKRATILDQYFDEEVFVPKIPEHSNTFGVEDLSIKPAQRYQFHEFIKVTHSIPNTTVTSPQSIRASYLQKQNSQNKVNDPATLPTIVTRNTDCIKNETRATSIIRYVGSKCDTNLEHVLSPTFDNKIEDNESFKPKEKDEVLEDVNSTYDNSDNRTPETKLDETSEENEDICQTAHKNALDLIHHQLISDSDEPLIPLKKRSRMHECVYPITHGINRRVLPVMAFTFEEEFSIVDYMVRIQKYITMQHNYMKETLGNDLLTTKWVNILQYGQKIPYNQGEEKKLFDLAISLIKQNGVKTFPDLKQVNDKMRNMMLHSTIPALWILYLSIIEAHKNSTTGMDQVKQTLYFTDNLYGNCEQGALTNIRGMSYKDMERFNTPWAVNSSDEKKFDHTLLQVGGIMFDDIKLQALYHMLVMLTPSKEMRIRFRKDHTLGDLQKPLIDLIYRYLSNKSGWTKEKADQTTRSLLHLVDELHDCADIMYYRSLAIQSPEDVNVSV